MRSPLAMDTDARQAFLAAPRIGVLGIERTGGPPILSPIWYGYEPGGDVHFVIGRDSDKATALRAAGQASLCVQSEELPYAFVTIDGAVTVGDAAPQEVRLALAARYLGEELGAGYVESTRESDNIVVHLTPQRWRSNDFSKL